MRSRLTPVRGLPPDLGLRCRRFVGDCLFCAPRPRRPTAEVLGRQFREGQQQVGEVALRVNDDRRDAVDRGLLEQREAQAGLSAAGHADADGVGDKVLRVVQERSRAVFMSGRTRGRGRTRRASRSPWFREILAGCHNRDAATPRRRDAAMALTTRGRMIRRKALQGSSRLSGVAPSRL